MDSLLRKKHWEKVFQTKDTSKVSWYQKVPETSLKLIKKLKLPLTSNLIEVGAGDSYLGDFLIEKGYSNITLLDISEKALNTLKSRLGKAPEYVISDILEFTSSKKYYLWHDRAVFHFLTDKNEIKRYVKKASEFIESNGYIIIGTFSVNGPGLCSDLKVQQYSEKSLAEIFSNNFETIECFTENHTTPSGSLQNFVFCILRRR